MTNPHTGRFVYALFSEQARKTPGAVALTDNHRKYTYAQLDAVTNRLARFLQEHGVGPETVVGCWLHSSLTVAMYVLAISKAGGAYLLLDPRLPIERLRYMVGNAEPALVISDSAVPPTLPECLVVPTTQLELAAEALSSAVVDSAVSPESLAYIAYTSGSTGRPKGVAITQAATANHVLAVSELFGLGPGDRTPLMASFAFDMATEEIIPPLISGCTLVDAPVSTGMAGFTRNCREQGFTVLNIPAPLWHQWTGYLSDTGTPLPPRLRLVIVGSDKVYVSSFRQWQALPGAERIQWAAAYGVTEATVTSTFYLTADRDDLRDEVLMPIGLPIANVDIHILDEARRPVGVGEVGEIYIGGVGVARGYHRLPAKTRACFVPDARRPGAMYRTGDLARRRADGNVVWLGRRDSQVKINGLRIELAEIEAVIHEYPRVAEAIVVFSPSPDPRREGSLTGYLRTTDDAPLDETALRDFLGSRLQEHMIPVQFRYLDDLPVSLNGKVDRGSLSGIAR